MGISSLFAAFSGGAIYILIPGPAFLALLALGASVGRGQALRFAAGNFAGDLVWNALALIALIGAREVGAGVFAGLDLISGVYLGWLGARALGAKRAAVQQALAPKQAVLRGVAFGLTNPKGYPVALATFASLFSGRPGAIAFADLPGLFVMVAAGIAGADLLLVLIVGLAPFRRFHERYQLWLTRAAGVLFVGFGLHALLTGARALAPQAFSRKSVLP
jgi:threonine/homoserine/homoserine lactone efflux protein